MQPEIEIGPVTLQTFGIMFALAFIVAGLLLRKRFKEIGKPQDWAFEIVLVALVGGLIGARINFLAEHWSTVQDDLFGNIFSGSGLTWYGGLIGGVVATGIWAMYRRFFNVRLLDAAAPSLALGYAVGRIGCQISGDGDYGVAWSGPWAMSYSNGTMPTDQLVHPTPIYEMIAMGFVAWLLWRLRKRMRPGGLFALYILFSGIERFAIEFIRRNDDVLLGMTEAQVVSLLMIVASAVWLTALSLRGGISRQPVADS